MAEIDWKSWDEFKAKREKENPEIKEFYDGDEDPIKKWAKDTQKELEAELAAMTPEQREAARLEALARIEAARKAA